MKNVLKRFGNLTQARSAKVPLVIIALVAVIGFSFAACGGDSGGDDGPSPYLGEELTISDDQVYTRNESKKLINFDSNLDIKEEPGASGKIEGGKLTLTLVTPTGGLENISQSDLFKEYRWDDLKVEPSDGKGLFLEGLEITGSTDYNVVNREDDSGDEFVVYAYVNEDVKITGKGKLYEEAGNNDDGEFEHGKKTENINLSLKKGWNAVCWKASLKGDTYTESMSLRNPKNFKWVLYNYDDDDYDDEEEDD